MRLYSITPAFLLCVFSAALLCASQEIADAIAWHRNLRTPLNESDSLTPDLGPPHLFSRADKGKGKSTVKGPVQTAWEQAKVRIAKGGFGTVFEVEGGFPIDDGHKRVPAVIKRVRVRTKFDRMWNRLELVYLKSVNQLLAHGLSESCCYIVMPKMGMRLSKAEKDGFPVMKEEQLQDLSDELADYHEDKYGVRHLDVTESNTVYKRRGISDWEFAPFLSEKTSLWNQPNLKKWEGFLIDWGYAKFKSQPDKPIFQSFSEKC